jgi:2-methylisocitrate lyase-like PEP mutase family enzyme
VPATREAAEQLRALHHGPQPLVLVNAWDAISARIVESLGSPVVATTSAGISHAEGVPDGGLTREAMLARIAVIAKAVRIPVSADVECGFGQTVEDAVATARGAIEAGAVGINFEDGAYYDSSAPLIEVGWQVERIRAIRAAADGLGIPLVINARTDVMHVKKGNSDELCDEAIVRGRAYLAAGADCVYPAVVTEERLIARLTAEIPGPVNVLAQETFLPVARLAELGVRRISLGVSPVAHALAAFRRAATEMLEHGTCNFARDRYSLPELTALLERAP